MNGKLRLYVDQYGVMWHACSVRELHRNIGGKRPSKMYVDKKDGSTICVGYVVGRHWCTAFERVEVQS